MLQLYLLCITGKWIYTIYHKTLKKIGPVLGETHKNFIRKCIRCILTSPVFLLLLVNPTCSDLTIR